MLTAFTAVFTVCTISAVGKDRMDTAKETEVSSASFSSEEIITSMADSIEAAAAETITETISVKTEEASSIPVQPLYTVTEFESPLLMYTTATVNVRSGAGTDFDKVGKLKWGTQTTVTGETTNGWFEVLYDGLTAFISGDYMAATLPGTPYVFVGDSRTVQMKMAVGSTDKAYIAQVGEGYSYFKNTALPEISNYAGPGTAMIINFGVNDLSNAANYVALVNSNIDAWLNAGITVYYAAVTPVGSYPTVSNSQIESFNSKLQSELDSRVIWLDGYSYLTQTGFNTGDGLHYDSDTYRSLYSYYMSVISQGAASDAGQL